MQFWMCSDGMSLMRRTLCVQRAIVMPSCGEKVFGSLEVVLILSSAHRCGSPPALRWHDTQCLDCLQSPTGYCLRHAPHYLPTLDFRGAYDSINSIS